MNLWIRLSIIMLLVTSQPAQALLNLELTEGQNNQTQLVFAPIEGKASQLIKTTTHRILHHDLKRSGHFRLYQPNSDHAQAADYTLHLKINTTQHKEWMLHLSLNNDALAGEPALEITQRAHKITLRQAIHQLSDQLVKRWTQQAGINQSHITYVLKTPNESIASHARYRLMIADIDGQHTRPILTSNKPILSPAFSKDGQSIAYVSFEFDHPVIYVHHLKTQTRRLISNYPGINSAPTFTPDDKSLIVALSFKEQYPHLYQIRLRDGQRTRLTQGAFIDTEPYMTTDPNRVWFTSNRSGRPDIYVLNRSNKKVEKITKKGPYHSKPMVSAHHKWLLTLARDHGEYRLQKQALNTQESSTIMHAKHMEAVGMASKALMLLYPKRVNDTNSNLLLLDLNGKTTDIIPTPKGIIQDSACSEK
jgi:TolB protein